MYRTHFGLKDLPFRSTPDLDYFYKDADREQIVNALFYALERGDGIVKVVGEVGSGKTTLLRVLSKQLPDNYSIVYINTPNLSAHDILFFICVEFGLDVERDEQKYFLTKKLQDFLLNEHAQNRKPLVLIDEAQAMPIETLEEIRLLTNLETEQDKLLQIVLFGQPELDANLNQPQIRQFLSRIAHSISLEPLSPEDVYSYLNFRMRKAGYQGRDVFDLSVSKLIHRLAHGLPRNIHVLADKALLTAYSDNQKLIKPYHVDEAQKRNKKHIWLPVFASIILIFIVLGAYFAYSALNNQQQTVAEAVLSSQLADSEKENKQQLSAPILSEAVQADNIQAERVDGQLATETHGQVLETRASVNEIDNPNNNTDDRAEGYSEQGDIETAWLETSQLASFEQVTAEQGKELPELDEDERTVFYEITSLKNVESILQKVEAASSARYSIQLMTYPASKHKKFYGYLMESAEVEKEQIMYVYYPLSELFVVYYGFYEGYSVAMRDIQSFSQQIQTGAPFVAPKAQMIKDVKVSIAQYEAGV